MDMILRRICRVVVVSEWCVVGIMVVVQFRVEVIVGVSGGSVDVVMVVTEWCVVGIMVVVLGGIGVVVVVSL